MRGGEEAHGARFVVEDDPRLFDEVCRLLRLEGFEALGCDGFQSIAA